MAAAVMLIAKERGCPKIMFQVLCYPVADDFDTPLFHPLVAFTSAERVRRELSPSAGSLLSCCSC
jgi:hypothetical protein